LYLTPSGSQFDANLWQSVPPGKYEIYSNIGTCVAAYIVEQISGMDFRQ
jgi:CubicO group peptidase (beta-lactamase class C family)